MKRENDMRRLMAPIEGGEVALVRFGRVGAPPLLFSHANGFCASAYRQMFEAIGDRFDIFGVDLRGHGRTRLAADPSRQRDPKIFGADLSRLLDVLRAREGVKGPWRVGGHSLGGVASVILAAGRDDIAALRLIEPVLMPSLVRALSRAPFWPAIAAGIPLVRMARERRSHWPNRADVAASYARKPLFANFAPGVLDDYLRDGLSEDETGVGLSCAPEWEAANFAAPGFDLWRTVRAIKAPITVLAADHPGSTAPPRALARLRRLGAEVTRKAGATHLMPFEDPRGAAAFLAA